MTAARFPRSLGAALALLVSAGCVFPAVSHRTGRALEPEAIAAVQPGRTTKRDLFALLGPPMAIASPDEVVAIESPAGMIGEGGMCRLVPGGVYRVSAEAWFERFPAHPPRPGVERVYYWYSWESSGWNWYLLLGLYASCHNAVREVWVLLDEDAGTVEDVAAR